MEQAHVTIHLECGFFGVHLNAAPTAACTRHFELPWQHFSPAKTAKSHRNDLSVPIIPPVGKFYAHFSASPVLQKHTEHTEPHKRSKVSAPPQSKALKLHNGQHTALLSQVVKGFGTLNLKPLRHIRTFLPFYFINFSLVIGLHGHHAVPYF